MNIIQYSPEVVRYMQKVFPWAHQSLTQTASRSLQPFLHGSLGDRPTDRPRYSVGNNKQSTQWRSQILLLPMATTCIYWSSRLDRSNQLQQSAAIFSCKTKQVAVYVDTLQYSLEESVFHQRTRQVTQLFTYLLMHKLFSSCIQ